tara:strand:+ start:229 stop:582 length:354 start_codon:yes stop_codon:yes gene_type:complete
MVLLVGCSSTPTDLRESSDRKESWVADQPIEAVFRTYKDYIDNELAWDGLLGQRLAQESYFYGDSAEIAIKMTGNPMAQTTYLYFDLQKAAGSTTVTAWAHNRPWEKKMADFKALTK